MVQGTLGVINIYSIHRNPEVWENPEIFNPGRFLDKAGNVVNTHKIIPFGFGERINIHIEYTKYDTSHI